MDLTHETLLRCDVVKMHVLLKSELIGQVALMVFQAEVLLALLREYLQNILFDDTHLNLPKGPPTVSLSSIR